MELLRNIIMVIVSPRNGWEDVRASATPSGTLLSKVFYPMLAVLALTSFIELIYNPLATLSATLVHAIALFAGYFITFYVADYLLGGLYPSLVALPAQQERLSDYLIYNMIFLVGLRIVTNLLPSDFVAVNFLVVYLPLIVYTGTSFLELPQQKRARFTIIASILLLILPPLLQMLLDMLI